MPAKSYRLITPDGVLHSGQNLSAWIRDHPEYGTAAQLAPTHRLNPEGRHRLLSVRGIRWAGVTAPTPQPQLFGTPAKVKYMASQGKTEIDIALALRIPVSKVCKILALPIPENPNRSTRGRKMQHLPPMERIFIPRELADAAREEKALRGTPESYGRIIAEWAAIGRAAGKNRGDK